MFTLVTEVIKTQENNQQQQSDKLEFHTVDDFIYLFFYLSLYNIIAAINSPENKKS